MQRQVRLSSLAVGRRRGDGEGSDGKAWRKGEKSVSDGREGMREEEERKGKRKEQTHAPTSSANPTTLFAALSGLAIAPLPLSSRALLISRRTRSQISWSERESVIPSERRRRKAKSSPAMRGDAR